MVPAIRHYIRLAINETTVPRLRNKTVARVTANAPNIFNSLADHGLRDLAHPRPLAMAALVMARQTSL